MEMRAIEEIAIGEDLAPPLRPLAAVLLDSAISSHCSACFSTLPTQTFPPITPTFPNISRHVPTDTPTPLYCSLNCSSLDSALHSSSAERQLLSLFTQSPTSSWNDSSDLRLSLRLVHIFQNLPQECSFLSQKSVFGGKNESLLQENEEAGVPDDSTDKTRNKTGNLERIAGLMTNRESLVFGENQFECDENQSSVLQRIREGAKMMAKARRECVGEDVNVEKHECFTLEEMVLCLVMTNAVEVQGENGGSIGVAVYGATFTWINHCCSPNSCYRFLVGREEDEHQSLRIAPAAEGSCSNGNGDGLIMGGGLRYPFSERNGYGPRVVVRSIKAVSKGEEVTIAYTDLLQPKEIRQAELWLKYRFSCSCKRCGAVPATYVDCALQACSADKPGNLESSDDELDNLMQNFDDAITDYLSFGDSKSCCQKLEHLLCHGDSSDNALEPKKVKLPLKVKLHPFHHLSLNAYTTLASAYKVQASDILALSYELRGHKLEAFNMYKTSCAYSLLLAGVANHLFMFEPAIVPTVACFWINVGESLLNLARNSLWDAFLEREVSRLELSSLLTLRCNGGCVADTLEPNTDQKNQLYNCIANVTPKVWSLLSSESNFLKHIQNPVDLSWLVGDADSVSSKRSSQLEAEVCNDQVRMNLILLSVHCLRYGALLSSICYGLSVETNYYKALEALMKT